MTAMRERLLKRWLEMEIVPRPPFHGVATRYGRQQLVWALAVRRMQAMDPAPLPTIREPLIAMSGERVEAMAREACLPVSRRKRSASGLQARLPERRTRLGSTRSYQRGAPASAGGRASNWASAWSALAARIRSLCA